MKLYFYLISLLIFFCSPNANAFATTYYVDNRNGSDNNNGLSGDNEGGGVGPWQTLSKVDGFLFNSSDDVYFKCGETWNLNTEGLSDFEVDWSGNSGDRVVIGAYYMDASTERLVDGINYKCSGQLPTFDGDYAMPPQTDRGLINNGDLPGDCSSYIDFQDLRIIESNQEAFVFKGSSTAGCTNINARRLKTFQNWNSGYAVWGDVSNVLIENSETNWDNYERYQSGGASGKASVLYFIRSDGNGGKPSNVTFQNNRIIDNYGECANIVHPINLTIQDNLFYNNRKNDCLNISGHFEDEGWLIIRRNLFYQTDASREWKEPQTGEVVSFGDADVFAGEHPIDAVFYQGVSAIRFYNNLVAGYEDGFSFSNSSYFLENYPNKIQRFDKIYVNNNTFVDIEEYIISCGTGATLDYGKSIFIENNIFVKYDIDDSNCIDNAIPHDCCTGPQTGNCDEMWQTPSCDNDPDFDNVNFDYNNFSRTPLSADIRGPNDFYGDPLLVKNSGWMSLADGSLDGSEFMLRDGSPVKYTNEPIGAQFHFKNSNALSPPDNLIIKNRK